MRKQIAPLLYLSLVSSIPLVTWPVSVQAACVIAPTGGDDNFTCDSGVSPGFNDPTGNNTLIMSGTGTIAGNATFGPGNDNVELNGTGTIINGNVNQGDGNNIFRLHGGTVTGTVTQGNGPDIVQISGGQAAAINQGPGVDSYSQSGGTVQSLAQGDGHDTFNMSGGTITGAFEDGDDATMTGGTIGRVDMKLDDNYFNMSGGRIIGNLVTGFFNDTILISGTAFVGGNISVSGGVDRITVTGGTVNGQILASVGNDQFFWIGGGQIHGFILMGADNDTATLKDLTESIISSTPLIDGGVGNDILTFENTQAATPGRYTSWEQVLVQNNSSLALGGTFVLGDPGTGTGTVSVDGSSKLLVDTGVISPFTSGLLVTLNNGGMIDMTTGSKIATDTLTINGNYNGTGGVLALQTILGDDGSPSDKLVVSQGTISGTTGIRVTNLGGVGAVTLQDGIQVVQAINGAAGSGTAFTLAGPVSAGAFDYRLFKGGVTAGTEENYYLRSTLPPDLPTIIVPLPGPGEDPLPPNPGVDPVPIYRPEVSIYAALFPAAEQLVRGMLATYHERMGEQSQQRQTGAFPAGWGRVYGNSSRQSFAGTVAPTLDSSTTGYQVGTDVYASTGDNGVTQRAGFFVGHSRLKGNIKGFNGGWQDKDAGSTTLRSNNFGIYWTMINPSRAYLDLVLMGTRFDGNNESDRGVKMKTRGRNVAASAEVGWPLPLTQNWKVEPQAQVIVSKTRLDSQNDGISDVSYDSTTQVTTRLGLRLSADYQLYEMPLQPYARANVWHTRGGENTVTFADVTDIVTEQKSTTMNVSLGASLQVAKGVSLYGELGYSGNLDSNNLRGREGTLGVRMEF